MMNMYAWQNSIDVVETKVTIRRCREDRGFTITDLELYFGLSKQAIYRWEDLTKKTLPSMENLFALAKLYQVTMDELLVPAS